MREIYYNGLVYTGTLPLAEAFVVEDGRFSFAGSSQEAKALAEKSSILVDLKGNFVCSGFNDSHMHVLNLGNTLQSAQLAAHTDSLSELIRYMKKFGQEHPSEGDGWLIGRGWNQDYFTDVKRMPDRFDLDQVSTSVPVCAVRSCGHCLVVNSRALELLGITADVLQPDGGQIGIEHQIPDGRFYDNAMELVYAAIPAPDRSSLKDMLRAACRRLNACGITSAQSDDYSTFRNVPWQEVNAAYQELEQAGELTVRVYEQCNFADLKSLKEFIKAGGITESGSDLFKIGPLKLLGDGSLGSRTACLSRSYADDPSTCGLLLLSQETLDEMIGFANEHGMQAAVHAIGDACLDRVLSAYEKALAKHPRKDHRHGIVHCQITRPDQLRKIEELQLHVYSQSIFLDYDTRIVEARVGKELASTSYSWKTLLQHGVFVSNGTDCPVEQPDALSCMQCAVTRAPLGNPAAAYLPDQAYTVQEALDSYTIHGARSSFDESRKGRIAPGMLADFVVLGQNPFETAPERLKDIPVRATCLGGKLVFGEI